MNCTITKNGYTKQLVAAFVFAAFAMLPSLPAAADDNMVVAANTPSASAQASSQSDLRLTLDKIDLDMDTGKYDDARSLLNRLEAKYPNNPDVKAAEADLDNAMANTGSGSIADVSAACLPDSLAPNNNDILQRYSSSAKAYGCAGYNRRITDEAVEQIENVGGRIALPHAGGFNLNADLENDHINTTEPFVRTNGRILSFYGDRQQGTVTLDKMFSGGNEGAVSLFALDTTAGVGGQYALHDRWGATSIQANYNQPDWDYVESSVQYGTKSDVMIERKQIITRDIEALVSGGVNTYSLNGDNDAADAGAANINLDYEHPFSFFNQPPTASTWNNDQVTLGAHYSMEGEYFTYVNHRVADNSDPFHPLPATSYEVHSFTVSAAKTLLPNVYAEASGGYGINRISGLSAPLYGGSLTYAPWQRFGIDVHASRDLLGGQNSSEKEDIVGTSLKLTW